jgi:mannitol/fructose-specific phosphotransferase system IIA component (Ntr-type)
VNLRRLIQPTMVRLRLETPVPEPLEGEEELTARQVTGFKEEVLGEIAALFEASGRIDRIDRLHRELMLREGKASTAVGRGIAFPHIKTLRAREMLCAIALAPKGIPFDEPDDEPVRLIVGIVSPKDEERAYLHLVRRFSEVFLGDAALPEILEARDEHEVIRILSSYL